VNYLLDTCVISDFFKKIPSVIERYKAVSPEKIHISSITVMEIEYGLKLNLERAKKIRPLWNELLKYVQVIPYSPQCAIVSAHLRADLKLQGLPIGSFDLLIAGTSIAHKMVTVSSNSGEFGRIPGITLENWRQ
jgi:tRNA(fMet)-specific endonuclease VapC